MQVDERRLIYFLEWFAVLATALLASAGVALLGLAKFWRRPFRYNRAWLWLWLGFFLPLLGVSVASGHAVGIVFVATLLPVCLFAPFALETERRSAARGLIAALIVIAASFLADHLASAYVWQEPGFHEIKETFGQVTGGEQFDGGTRVWSLPDGTSSLNLQVEARKSSGASGWSWKPSLPTLQLERLGEGESAFTRATFPTSGDPYLMRTFHLDEPAAGKTFRASLSLRAQEPVPARGNRGIWTQVWGPGGDAGILPVALDREWQVFTNRWTVPDAATSPVIRLILNDFNDLTIDIQNVRLQELRDGEWHALEPLTPTGVSIELDWPERPDSLDTSLHFTPTETWQTYSLEIESQTLRGAEEITGRLAIESGLGVQIRDLSLTTPSNSDPSPSPVRQRRSLWFGHPNNAGHVTLVTGLAALLTLRSGWMGLVTVVLTLAGIAFTGSRTAWLAGIVALPWMLWFTCRPRQRFWVYGALIAAGGVVLAVLGPEVLGRLTVVGVENPLTRLEIWRVAWQGLIEHPWTGVGPGPDSFSAYFTNTYGGANPEIVPTAHNLWLVFASEYGVFGLLAVLWLTLGLAFLAWHWGRWRGLAFLLPIFALNSYDYSLFSWWVLFLVILGFNQLEGERRAVVQTDQRLQPGSFSGTSAVTTDRDRVNREQ